jgi:hypothetical protein
MMPQFDVFQTETDGSLLWLATAATLDDAKARVHKAAASSPGEYVILNLQTGLRLTINNDGASRGNQNMRLLKSPR